jgi:hypothetical protein
MATELNLTNIFYTAYRLSPFILVSFFTLSSILNQDIKGIIYLAGLLIACFASVIIGKINVFKINTNNSQLITICNSLNLTNGEPFSNLPLSMTVFTYTFGYLLYIIGLYGLAGDNIMTIIFFSIIIVADWTWNIFFSCNTHTRLIGAFLVGSAIGISWSAIIASTNQVSLQYFNGISNKEVCSLNKDVKFKCVKNK